MDRIVVAIANEILRKSVSDHLKKSGLSVRSSVGNASAAIRELKQMEGGVLISSAHLTDGSSDSILDLLGDSIYLLVIGSPRELALCKRGEAFKVPLPVNPSGLVGSVRILTQLDERRQEQQRKAAKRSGRDKKLIKDAKAYLMDARGMSEEEAHRFLQKQSMDTATPVAEIAKMIIANE